MEQRWNLFETIEQPLREHYEMRIDPNRVDGVYKTFRGTYYKRIFKTLVGGGILILIGTVAGAFFTGVSVGVLAFWLMMDVIALVSLKKGYKDMKEVYATATYIYELYENFLLLTVYSDSNFACQKVPLYQIKRPRIIRDYVVIEIKGKTYLLNKEQLAQESYFISICNTED